ncbi:MAG: DUF72 domain-containing protein [Chlorobi bacterium]|nr:DUF72 domain-containing protein [Chlorobiota bacterium]
MQFTLVPESDPVEPARFKAIRSLVKKGIFIGTSGWSYEDWVGPFYPPRLKKPQMLPYYQQFFPVSEINYTYYSMPTAATLEQIRRKAARMRFAVKAHKSLTHERSTEREGWKAYADALEPLRAHEQLAAVLFQFPYSFKCTQHSYDYLAEITGYFETLPLVMEFRHSSWFHERTYDIMRKWKVALCSVDAPRLPGLTHNEIHVTSSIAYYRLHGRRAEEWFSGDNITRYDYSYSDEEIRELAENVVVLHHDAETVYVFANNHPRGQAIETAVKLARELQGLLNVQ